MVNISKVLNFSVEIVDKIRKYSSSKNVDFNDSVVAIVDNYIGSYYDDDHGEELKKNVKTLPKKFVVDILFQDPITNVMEKYKNRTDKENVYDELISEHEGSNSFIYRSYHLFLIMQYMSIKLKPINHDLGDQYSLFEGDDYYILVNRLKSFKNSNYRKKVFLYLSDVKEFVHDESGFWDVVF